MVVGSEPESTEASERSHLGLRKCSVSLGMQYLIRYSDLETYVQHSDVSTGCMGNTGMISVGYKQKMEGVLTDSSVSLLLLFGCACLGSTYSRGDV